MSQVARGRTLAAIAVGLTACNPLYGLDKTKLEDVDAQVIIIDRDRDDDGVVDDIDLCADIYNPFQENADGDEYGDVCDPCPTGSDHNEDGDALRDGCDNCPQIANDDQANADGDDLGDVCDPSSARQERRRRFDGFGTLSTDWIPGAQEWQVANDSVAPFAATGTFDLGLWNRYIDIAGPSWYVEVHVQLTTQLDEFAGIRGRDSNGADLYLCYVLRQSSTGGPLWLVSVSGGPAQQFTPVNSGATLRLYRENNMIKCSANGVVTTSSETVVPLFHPGLHASSPWARYSYIDAVTAPP